MRDTTRKNRNPRRGGSMVEFAVTMPLLLLMAVAAGDFSRMFLESTSMSRAAASGVKYGAMDNRTSGEYATMQRLADNSASHVANAVATADRVCDCPDAPKTWVNCLTTSCPNSYGQPRAYARVGVAKTFSTMGYYPGIPQHTNIHMRGYMRVQ
jgi:Flp pilus assembly protein TadG